MEFDWYKIFNLLDFEKTSLVSRIFSVTLEGRGAKDILVVKGNELSLVYEDVLLPIEFEEENPFVREGSEGTYAVYKDIDSNVWIGIEVQE